MIPISAGYHHLISVEEFSEQRAELTDLETNSCSLKEQTTNRRGVLYKPTTMGREEGLLGHSVHP